jgi:hypothetical protein
MVRLLRRVLSVGLLAGIGAGIFKVVRGRRAPDPWGDSWVSTGAPGATRPSPAPVPAAPPKPPAPAGTATAEVAVPPPAAPSPPAPAAAETGSTTEGEQPAAKAAPGRAKPSRTGPARKSPTGKAEEPPGERLWVQANDGVCPQTHPVKAKLSSKIFHTPGSRNYSRTQADRCYPDEASAQADGLRPALR